MTSEPMVRDLRDLLDERRQRIRAMVVPSLLALGVVNVFLKLYMG